MKIGIFTNIYLPGVSGVITAIENYRKELENQGHEVYIFASEYKNYKDDNPRIFRFKSIDLRFKTSYPLPIISSPRVGRIIKKLDLDIIHTQHFLICGQIAWYYARKLNIPLVFTHHTRYDLSFDYLPIVPKEIGKPLAQVLCAFYSDTCNGVIAPSQDVKNLLLKYKVKTPISVIPTGINAEFFSENKSGFLRKKYNLDANAVILLTISRLEASKNIPFLIKTFRIIARKNPNAYLVVVGGGPYKKNLEHQAIRLGLKNRIIFTGAIEHKDIVKYYSSADIFVFNSLGEIQPLVLIEAMANRLPVVATDATGVRDIVADKENGFLCSYNENEFVKRISQLINNPEMREAFSIGARKTAQKYSIEKSAKKLIAFYKQLESKKQKKKKIIDFTKLFPTFFDSKYFSIKLK
jgi:glycosyltransferase involved in cell wall biosynthesis